MKEIAIVSGSHGFIGQHLVKALEKKNIKVIPLDRTYLHLPFTLKRFLEETKPDYIYHLAAYGNMANQKGINIISSVNLMGTFNLLNASLGINYKAFINISTSSVKLPYQTIYSATKAGAEKLCNAFIDEYQKPIVIVRPYSVYGIGEADFRFIPTVFRSCLTGEEMILTPDAVHDWVYIDDLIKCLVKAPDHAFHKDTLLVGTGLGTSNRDVVSIIERITGKKANIKEEKQMRSFDTKIWVAPDCPEGMTSLEDGLIKIYESIKE